MSFNIKNISILCLCLSFFMYGYGQELKVSETEVDLSKDAKKAGSYFGGGYDQENEQVVAIFSYPTKKEGVLFDIYRFDKNNQPMEPVVGIDVAQLAENLNYTSTDTEVTNNYNYDGANVILVRSNFIGRELVIEKGHLNHEQGTILQVENARNPFTKSKAWNYDKLLYEKDDKEKVDIDFMPMGTLVSEGRFPEEMLKKIKSQGEGGSTTSGKGVFALAGAMADQFKEGQSAVKAGLNSAFMKEGGKAVVIGRVVEKVKIGNPVPWNNNRLRIATVDASSMTAEEKETIVMPFAFIPAEKKAIDENQKLVALLVPLNSPNTVKEAKQYQMDKENRNRVMVTIVNAQGELVDTTEYRSAGNDGIYAIKEIGDAIYIPAVVDGKQKGFYNGLVNKPTHFQITKVENGNVVFNRSYDFETIEEIVKAPTGEKFKGLKIGTVSWGEHQQMKNGEVVFFANDEDNFYAFHIDPKGNLKSIYTKERYDSKGRIIDSQFVTNSTGDALWMTRETPEGVASTEFDISESVSSSTDYFGTTYTTTATATPRNVLEIKSVTKITPVALSSGNLGSQKIIGGKNYLVVGDTGFLVDKEGNMLLIGYDLNRRKSLYSVRLSK